jgi:hypothetical protein
MRTKTTLLTAALVAAGAATSMAQVYSLNVVGYINVSLTNGFQLVSCPLQASPDNTLNTLFGNPPSLPAGSAVYKFSGASGSYSAIEIVSSRTGAWSLGGTNTLNPGEGAFLKYNAPAGGPYSTNVTFVGQVEQASGGVPLSNPLYNGYQILGSQVPVTGGIQSNLGYSPAPGDIYYAFDAVNQTYAGQIYTFSARTLAWTPNEPTNAPGQGFFLKTSNTSPWTNNFIVQ